MQANAAALASPAIRPSTVRWKIFLMMLFLISINYIDRASLSVAMPLIAKEFDIGPAVQGLLLSSFFWTYALMQIPGGMLADRYRPARRDCRRDAGLGLLPGHRRRLHRLGSAVLTRLGLGCGRGADLSGPAASSTASG
jgi:ACS family D-galactonate transporter-like MFS transporter